jgi:hypothetical protein
MPGFRRAFSMLLSVSVTISSFSTSACKQSGQEQSPPPGQPAQTSTQTAAQGQAPAATYAAPTADQLYQLVAPIALFPDNLVAQVLAASTFPDEVTAANSWLAQNANLKGDQLMQAVNQQSWDASVKGLTQFPDVLAQLATNLAWTSALGDAYFNIPQSVMNAVQTMRQRAYQSGNLKSNPQQNVTVQDQAPGAAPAQPAAEGAAPQVSVVQPPAQTIIIQPAQPEVVYVPTYNPTVVYGAPVAAYPGYSTGAMVATSLISFGVGVAVGAAISGGGCCGWGWNSWGCGWHNSTVVYNHNTYISNSNTFVNRNNYYNRNVNNVNRNNYNNVNRNNYNNVNRNNYNANNRVNNFNNTARNNNYSTPNFNQKYNQPQYQNRGNQAQNNRGNQAQNNRGNQAQNYRGNQAQNNRQQPGGMNQSRPNQQGQNRGGGFNNSQRDASRGYGQQASRGTNTGAFSNYSQGGNARTNSARGQQSFQGNRGGGASRQAAAHPRGGRR